MLPLKIKYEKFIATDSLYCNTYCLARFICLCNEWMVECALWRLLPYVGVLRRKKTGQDSQRGKKDSAGVFCTYDVKIGKIKEKEWFFEADIKDRNSNLIDKVIIDKRTGRIR